MDLRRCLRLASGILLRRRRDERDIQMINARAAGTNRESDIVLDLQAWPD